MGIQKGALKLRGSHGDFTFTETTDGFKWKKKRIAVTMDRINSDPDLAKVKANITEFSRAGKGVKLLREIFKGELKFAKDRRLTSRMQTRMLQVVKSDPVNDRGERLITEGNLSILERLELNGNAELIRSLPVEMAKSYDRPSGKIEISCPSFVPAVTLVRAPNVTHFMLICAAAEVDFENGTYRYVHAETVYIPVDNATIPPVVLNTALAPASALPVFVVAGIRYAEIVNGFTHPESNGEFNALSLVLVDKP